MTAATMFMLEALKSCPGDPTAWMVFADSLEEIGMTAEAEVVRLRTLLQDPECADRTVREDRLRHLLYVDKIDPPVVEHTNSIGMRFVLIPPGTFWMGSPEQEEDRHNDEGPRHRVTLTKPFWMGMHQVTRQQWETVMGNDPSGFQNGSKDCPVEQVRWNEAYEFCRKLSELPEERATNSIYRLPTEAEWEYACRGGTTTVFHYGNSISSHMANFDGNYPYGDGEKGPYLRRTTPVGSYLPNSWKLYDMHGNVWEWCADGYDSTWYANSPEFDPVCANPYPNGVPWGNRAKKKEVEAEKPGSFQESTDILEGEGDQERQLDQQQSILPVGEPPLVRAEGPVQWPGIPNIEGGEVLTDNTFQGDPKRRLEYRLELPVGVPWQARADATVHVPGIPTSERGESVEESFRADDTRRQLVQLQTVLPVGIPLLVRSDGPVQRSELSDSEGSESVENNFRPCVPGQQLERLQPGLPVGIPGRVRADGPERLPELSSNEGGESVENTFPEGIPGRQLAQPRLYMPLGVPQQRRADVRERFSGISSSEGDVSVEASFQSSNQGRQLEQFQPVFPVSVPIQDQSDVPGLRCGVPNTEGGEVLIDDIFRSVEATNNQGRQLELLSPVLPVGIPLLVRTDRPDTQPGLPDSNGGEVLTDYPFRSVNQGRQLELQRQELSIDGSRQVRAVGLEHHPEPSDSKGGVVLNDDTFPGTPGRLLEQLRKVCESCNKEFEIPYSRPKLSVGLSSRERTVVPALRPSASERGNDLVENPFRRNKLPRRVRGSGWHNFGTICRAAHHDWYLPMIRSSDSGFRILKEVSL